MDQWSTTTRGIKWTKFDMGFKDINNWVATNGAINGDKVIKDITNDDIVDLHSCSRLKCTGELMVM
jgi:hypothetical protein